MRFAEFLSSWSFASHSFWSWTFVGYTYFCPFSTFFCMKKVHDDDLTLFSSSSSSSFCFFLSLVCGSFVGCDLFVFWPNGCESKGPIHTSHWLSSLSLKLGFEPILSFSSLSTYWQFVALCVPKTRSASPTKFYLQSFLPRSDACVHHSPFFSPLLNCSVHRFTTLDPPIAALDWWFDTFCSHLGLSKLLVQLSLSSTVCFLSCSLKAFLESFWVFPPLGFFFFLWNFEQFFLQHFFGGGFVEIVFSGLCMCSSCTYANLLKPLPSSSLENERRREKEF